ncbi:18499_t:CDS:2 [Dentiscutata erythropus]|uniref:18499_t:CDS:1 n=1 Tax=Dentiscutata erythropus TaxID=1348616 RepID=A0A9N9IG60_9GLOM|nr:18499_t:CDS:2 [Dentiscutata erythropus]
MEYAENDEVSNEPSAVNKNDPLLTSEENARERAQDIQSHLAIKCKKNTLREIRIKVLRDM